MDTESHPLSSFLLTQSDKGIDIVKHECIFPFLFEIGCAHQPNLLFMYYPPFPGAGAFLN
jgi:hypothetical protein